MANLRANSIVGVGSTDAGVVFDGITKIKTQNYFYLQTGNTLNRSAGISTEAGAMRFNSDSQKLEYYDGAQWLQVSTFSPNLNGGARGVFAGGYKTPGAVNNIDYINISSTGNAQDFGDLAINAVYGHMMCASSTRGIVAGGSPGPTNINTIQYITISSTGNTQDFGDLTTTSYQGVGLSNASRGIFFNIGATNIIDYITIASTGNAQDFGDSIFASSTRQIPGSCSSPTRGICAGGGFPTVINSIEYITIASTGNGQDFGDLTSAKRGSGGFSNAIRGVFGPGSPVGGTQMDYITIATLGNSVNFGNLITSAAAGQASCSSPTRGVFGNRTPGNTIEYVTILTQGNSVDFGDLITPATSDAIACSNAHGGL